MSESARAALPPAQALLSSNFFDVLDADEAIEFCYAKGWTDGLPVVPPTQARVLAMLSAWQTLPSATPARRPAHRARPS